MKRRKRIKLSTKLYIIISLIIFFTLFLLNSYFKNLNPKIITVTKEKIRDVTTNYLSVNVAYDLFKDININDILIINTNDAGEILYVDYNIDKAYEVLELVTDEVISSIYKLEKGYIMPSYYDQNLISTPHGLMLRLPMLISSKNALLSNLGPQIYLKINLSSSILTNIKTKITNYGFNNALVELYVTLIIKEQILSPVIKDTVDINYNVLVAAKVINGRVPEFYGSEIIKESGLYENSIFD